MTGQEGAPAREVVLFGPFRMISAGRLLERGGVRVDLGARAFDILLALTERPGEVVGKGDLLRKVWADVSVEEGNIRVHVSALRKALGDGLDGARYIATIPGRGYCFVAPVRRSSEMPADVPAEAPERDGSGDRPALPGHGSPAIAAAVPRTIPAVLTELIGRGADLSQVLWLQSAHRLLTLAGPGGIGKTSLALAAARSLDQEFGGEVRLADLAVLDDPDLVVSAVASALDLQRMPLPVSARRVAELVGPRRLLLVIDNCEHLVGPVADLVEHLLLGAPNLQILVTSQEPLRAAGECVYRVPPLAIGDGGEEHQSGQPCHGAVELFIARAQMADWDVAVQDAAAVAVIGTICRRLDGIPLAIELAAALTPLIGLRGVAAGLDQRFELLRSGRRTAHPRQQTMRAALDWSFELLSAREREVLCQLGLFVGSFPLEAAEAVAAASGEPGGETAACVASLVAHSLVNREPVPHEARYRLLETIRLYAQEHLAEIDEHALRRRHLRYYAARMQRGLADWRRMPASEWLSLHGSDLENVRAALHWGLLSELADPDDALRGAELAAASMPLWLESSLHAEARQWAERALRVVGLPAAQEAALQIALGTVLLNTEALSDRLEAAFRRGLELAEVEGELDDALRALYGSWVHALHENDYPAAQGLAMRFRLAAERTGDPADVQIGDRLLGTSEHYLGRQDAARSRLEGWLTPMPRVEQRSQESRFGLDQRVGALTSLARVMALQGELERAAQVAQLAVEAAGKLNRAASLCHSLGDQCIIALWTGALGPLAPAATALATHTSRHGLGFWRPHALVAQAVLAVGSGDGAAATALLTKAMGDVGADRFDLVYPSLTGAVAEGLAYNGLYSRAMALLDQALGRAEVMRRWYASELLLVRGNLTMQAGGPADLAERDFLGALDHARAQSALLLELRAATGLARLRRGGRDTDRQDALHAALSRFKEGLDTPHVRAARETLASSVR